MSLSDAVLAVAEAMEKEASEASPALLKSFARELRTALTAAGPQLAAAPLAVDMELAGLTPMAVRQHPAVRSMIDRAREEFRGKVNSVPLATDPNGLLSADKD